MVSGFICRYPQTKEATERFWIILHQICGCYYIQMRFPNFFQCSLVFFEYQLSVARNATQQLFVESALISILYAIVIAEGHPTTECFQILRSASNVFFLFFLIKPFRLIWSCPKNYLFICSDLLGELWSSRKF